MFEIYDIDGTLTTSGDTPNVSVIDYMRSDAADSGTKFIIVSARPIARLDETKAWLDANNVPYEQLYLNDFEGAGEGPNVGLAFKRAKYEMLIAEYGTEEPDGIDYAVDNDPEVIAMARELGIEAKTPTELMAEESDDVAEDATESEDAPARAQFKEIEMRSAGMGEFNITEGEDGQRTFSGYAALFDSPSIGLPFTETIKPGAFKRSLSRANAGQKIIAFLFGHEETRALATTASGRLKLEEDSKGLRVEAKLDPSDPDAAKVISMLTHEAAAAGMSFGFTVPKGGDSWVGEDRQLKEVNLIEASILSPGQQAAYPATTGLAAVRKITAPRLGIEAERLISTLESVKAGKSLSEDEVLVLDTVRARLAPARASMDPSIASAKLKLAELENETL
jgi:HK97 family phage prohead protease